jgi:hypothetical protein
MARKIDASVARGQMRALVNPQVRFRAKISATGSPGSALFIEHLRGASAAPPAVIEANGLGRVANVYCAIARLGNTGADQT